LRARSISSGDIVSSGSATSAGGGSILAESALSAAGAPDALPPAFFGAPSSGLPDTLLDFLAVADFVFLADDFVSEPASDDCASESLPFDFLADDFALPIT
jgi:hypothetical protein